MGLFNFIKSAGRRLGLGGSDTQDESHPAPEPPAAGSASRAGRQTRNHARS